AYPDGRFDVNTASAVASTYQYAYTTCQHQLSEFPLVTIPRKILWEHSCTDAQGRFSPAVMSCLAVGMFDLISKCGHRHGSAAGTDGRSSSERVGEEHLN